MAVKVAHRPDQLLQDNVRNGCPSGLEDTFIGWVSVPTEKALLEFLDEKVVGREFPNDQKLQEVLDTWPEYAGARGLRLRKEFATLRVSPRGTIACPDKGMGGPFEVGLLIRTS